MSNTATLNQLDDVMTTSAAARLLGVSEGLVRLLADQGSLPCRRVDRLRLFVRADALKLLAARGGEATR